MLHVIRHPVVQHKLTLMRQKDASTHSFRTLLHEIERDGFHVLQHKVSLTPLRKLWLAWKTWVRP